MPPNTTRRDILDLLTRDMAIAAFLDACLEDGAPNFVGTALGDIARAMGITDLAAQTGLPADVLALSGETAPNFRNPEGGRGPRLTPAAHPNAAHAA